MRRVKHRKKAVNCLKSRHEDQVQQALTTTTSEVIVTMLQRPAAIVSRYSMATATAISTTTRSKIDS